MRQFRNFDSQTTPQVVNVHWRMETPRDEHAGKPDEMGAGFWPSNDPNDDGYIGDYGDLQPTRYAEAKEFAEARMRDWRNDVWEYVGVVAVAEISIPIGGNSFTTYALNSPGCWGVESDSGDYLNELFEEQKAELIDHLKQLGAWAALQP